MSSNVKYVCECKSVKAFEIRDAVRKQGAQTLVDIQNITKASTGCGRCKPQVVDIMSKELKKRNISNQQLRLDI